MMMNLFILAIWGMVGIVSSSSESMIRHAGHRNDHVQMFDNNIISNTINEDVRDLQTTCDFTDLNQLCPSSVWVGNFSSYCSGPEQYGSDPNALALGTWYDAVGNCDTNSCCSQYLDECCHPETSCSTCSESSIYYSSALETTCGSSSNINMNKMSLYVYNYSQNCMWGCCSSNINDCCSDYEPTTYAPSSDESGEPSTTSTPSSTDDQLDESNTDDYYEPPTSTTNRDMKPTAVSSDSGKSPAGAVAGVLIVVVILAVGGIFWYRKKDQSSLPYTYPPSKIDDSTGGSDPTENVETPSPQQEQPLATQGAVPIFSSSGTVPNTETNPPQNPNYTETNPPEIPIYNGASFSIQQHPSSSIRIDTLNERVRIGLETTQNVANGLVAANDLMQQISGITSALFVQPEP